MNGYVKNAQNEMFMWIGKRSESKQTWPGKLDNTVSFFCNIIIRIGKHLEKLRVVEVGGCCIEVFENRSVLLSDFTAPGYIIIHYFHKNNQRLNAPKHVKLVPNK